MTTEKINWYKLDNFANEISREIWDNRFKKVPFVKSTEEIKEAVYDSFIYLINNFKDGNKSVESYCYRYAEKLTLNKLHKEYKHMKNNTNIDQLIENRISKKDYYMRKSCENEEIIINEKYRELVKSASLTDLEIMKYIMCGLSYDKIGEIMGISHQAISKRMQKYSEKI